MPQVKMYRVQWNDEAGPQQTRPMSMAEANEEARQLRFHQAMNVQVVPAYPVKPKYGHE